MRKLKLFKTLLVAAGLTMGASAWAATKTYDFQTFAKTLSANLTLSGNPFEDVNGLTLDGRFYGVGTWLIQRNNGLYSSNGGGRAFSVYNLKVGDKITFVKDNVDVTFTSTNAKVAETGVAVTTSDKIVSGTTYEITADGTLSFNATRYVHFYQITIETAASETLTSPKIEITGANGGDRIVTITNGTSDAGNDVTTYYTTDGSDPTSASSVYSAPITISSSCTIKAVTISSESTSSEVTSLEVNAGATLSLNDPTIEVKGVSENGDSYILTFGASTSNSSIIGNPTATLTATFEGNDVTDAINAGTFVPTTYGKLVVVASASGYESATTTLSVSSLYTRTWQSVDFSSLTDDNVISTLGDEWSKQSGTGRWASWSDGTYTYYQHGEATGTNMTVDSNLRMRDVIILNLGFGLSRNVSGTEAINFVNSQEGYVAEVTVYNGYGKALEGNTYKRYMVNTGSGISSLGCNNGTVLVQAAYYAPNKFVSVPVTSAGFATYANHDYALDFTNVSGLTAYTATVSGDVVTFTPATKVPAGTGLLLKGATADVPVIASADAISDNILFAPTTGVTGLNYDADGYYNFILTQPAGKEIGFYRANNNSVAAGKAYLRVSQAGSARQFTFIGLDGEATTGIEAINTAEQKNGEVYNLQGQRMAKTQKGLFIVNGKKVIMK